MKLVHVGIEQLETSDQKSFWKEIGKKWYRTRKEKDIPIEVKLENGDVSNKLDDVLHAWKTSFENLVNRHNDSSNVPVIP